jgi:hypothetical protein
VNIDDTEVFFSPALDGGLNWTAGSFHEEVFGPYDHAFAAAGGELLPPAGRCFNGGRVFQIDRQGAGGLEEVLIGLGETVGKSHVPSVGLIHVNFAFRCEEMEGGEFVIIDLRSLPTIGAIGFTEHPPSPPSSGPRAASEPSRQKQIPSSNLLFHTATTLQDAFRTRLKLPNGRIGAIAALHTFGDSLKIA